MASFRLMEALRALGHDARMIAVHKFSDNPNVMLAGSAPARKLAFLAERAEIFANNGLRRKDLFKVSTGKFGVDPLSTKFAQSADAYLIGWVNQGLLSLNGLRKLCASGKPVICTMHDMWCMTGICHHAFGCRNFTADCGNCKFLHGSASPRDLSARVMKRKRELLEAYPELKFVAVSGWVKRKALESSLLADRDISVVGNPFPIDDFKPLAGATAREKIIVFGAARLDDDVKRLDLAIDSLNILADSHPELTRTARARFIGSCRDMSIFNSLRFPYETTGPVAPGRLPELYGDAAVVLSTSEFETLGGTLVEGMASGAVPVSYGEGGQSDFIDHLTDGYIARHLDAADTARGILWALNSDIAPESLHSKISRPYSPTAIANLYVSIINQMKQ